MDQVRKNLDETRDELVIDVSQSKEGWRLVVGVTLLLAALLVRTAVDTAKLPGPVWFSLLVFVVPGAVLICMSLSLIINRNRIVARRNQFWVNGVPIPRQSTPIEASTISGFIWHCVNSGWRPNIKIIVVQPTGGMLNFVDFLPSEEAAAEAVEELNRFYGLPPVALIGYTSNEKDGAIFPEYPGLKIDATIDQIQVTYNSTIRGVNGLIIAVVLAAFLPILFAKLLFWPIVYVLLVASTMMVLSQAREIVTGDKNTLEWRTIPSPLGKPGHRPIAEITSFVGRERAVDLKLGKYIRFSLYAQTKTGDVLILPLMQDLGQARALAWGLNQFYGLPDATTYANEEAPKQ